MELGEGIKKILLAGIGTAAVTAEKSKEVLDELVKKGELTVEQGKVLNQELKHNIKESVKKNVNVTLKPSNPDELKEVLGKMTPDQLAALKEQISKMQAKDVDAEETAEEEEDFSANYLGSYMLQLAGLEMPGYNQFLMNLKEQLPIIGVGAVCDKDGNWYANDALPDDYKKLMTDYNILEYNNQFEKKDVIESLFTLK